MKTLHFAFATLLLSVCLFACQNKGESVAQAVDYATKYPNAVTVKEKAAIITAYSSEDIEAIRKKFGDEAVAEIGSDAAFYSSAAKEALGNYGIKVIETDKSKVVFVKNDGTVFVLDKKLDGEGIVSFELNKKKVEGDMFFFSPDKAPKDTYTADFQKGLSYFGITTK